LKDVHVHQGFTQKPRYGIFFCIFVCFLHFVCIFAFFLAFFCVHFCIFVIFSTHVNVIQKEERGAGGSSDEVAQRVQEAAADAAKKLEDAAKEAEETARVAASQAVPEEAQVSLSGSTATAAF
jgi:hypothetical protein